MGVLERRRSPKLGSVSSGGRQGRKGYSNKLMVALAP
jgi:hypothetical protein